MHRLKFILTLILISTKLMGQIICSQTNERFETFVNDIVRQNIGRQIEFVFSAPDSGKINKTEIIKVGWEKANVIIVSQASTDYGSTLDKLRTNKHEYVDGYFSDLVKEKGNYIEVTKTADKSLVLKGYRDGKIAVENKITLDANKETIFSDYSNYYAGSPTKPVRTITSYSKTIVDKSTTITTQESYDITSGVKKLNHKFETTETASFDKKTSIKTLTCKTKATLSIGSQADSESKIFLTLDSSGKITKVEYPDKRTMTVRYK
jgi:hypothetical protein